MEALGNDLAIVAAMGDEAGITGGRSIAALGRTTEAPPAEAEALQRLVDGFIERKSRPILVYCHHSSCFLSYNAALRLHRMGYTTIYWMRDGLAGWKAANYAVGFSTTASGGPRGSYLPPPAESIKSQRYPYMPNGLALWGGEHCRFMAWILAQVTAVEGGRDHYQYQVQMYAFAGVGDADDPTTVRRKVRAWWAAQEHTRCDSVNQGVTTVLSYAISNTFDDFVTEAVDDWKVPLNEVNQYTGTTVLDDVASRLERDEGTSLEVKYRTYYRLLRENGAKHRSELEQEGLVTSIRQVEAEALKAHEAAAANGDIESAHYLYASYGWGVFGPIDLVKSRRYFARWEELALTRNDGDAMTSIGHEHAHHGMTEKPGLPPESPQTASTWYRRSAETGSPTGMLFWGRSLMDGYGVPQDEDAALFWFHKLWDLRTLRSSLAAPHIGVILYDRGQREEGLRWIRYNAAGGEQSYPVRDGENVRQWLENRGLGACGPTIDPDRKWC